MSQCTGIENIMGCIVRGRQVLLQLFYLHYYIHPIILSGKGGGSNQKFYGRDLIIARFMSMKVV